MLPIIELLSFYIMSPNPFRRPVTIPNLRYHHTWTALPSLHSKRERSVKSALRTKHCFRTPSALTLRRLDLPPSGIPTPSTALPWPLHKVIAMAWTTPTMTQSPTLHSLPSQSPPSQTASGCLGGCKSNLIGRRLWRSRCPARALRTSSPMPFPLSDILSSCRQRSARGWWTSSRLPRW